MTRRKGEVFAFFAALALFSLSCLALTKNPKSPNLTANRGTASTGSVPNPPNGVIR